MKTKDMMSERAYRDLIKPFAIILLVALACIFVGSAISDDSEALDGGWYTLDESTGVLTVTGNNGTVGSDIRDMVKKIVITDDVTNLDASAFYNCRNATEVEFEDGSKLETIGNNAFCYTSIIKVTIPASVKTIGQNAFSSSQSLTAVHFAADSKLETIGNYAFNNCTSLKTIDKIPASVTSIGYQFIYNTKITTVEFDAQCKITNFESVFTGAQNLKSIKIPNSVTNARGAFQNCSALSSVTIGSGLTALSDYMFENCTSLVNISLPNTVIALGNRVFSNTGLENVTISLNELGNQLFQNCKSLKIVNFTTNPTTIPNNMFSGCTSLVSVNGIEYVTSFGTHVFQNCTSLKQFTVPDGVTALSDYMFYGAGLESIDLNNVREIGSTALANTNIDSIDLSKVVKLGGTSLSGTKMTYLNLTGITDIGAVFSDSGSTLRKVVLDPTLTTIPDYMFYNCTGLTSIEYGDEIISFGSCAFYGCTSLSEIRIPEKLQTIGYQCFSDCTSLTKFVAGSNVNSIGQEAFRGCSSLESIDLSNSCLTILDMYAIYRCDALTELLLPDTLNAIHRTSIYDCDSLKFLDIPASVTKLGYDNSGWNKGTFTNCHFEDITGGEGLSDIYSTAFGGMIADKISLDLKSSTEYEVVDGVLCRIVEGGYHAILFPKITGDYVMPDNIVSAEKNSMSLVSATSITFSSSMKNITMNVRGDEFGNSEYPDMRTNSTLKKVVIPEGVISIGQQSNGIASGIFAYCYALEEVILPSTLETIYGGSFRSCTSLVSITLPENLRYLGTSSWDGSVFENCTSLKEVNLPYNVNTIWSRTFMNCSALESIDLSYVETIGGGDSAGAFSGCVALKEIKLGQYLGSIEYSFNGCDSLETLTLDGLELYLSSCFNNCKSLKKVIISADVKTLTGSFSNCPKLEEIEVSAENPYFYMSGGVLYSADLSTILYVLPSVKNLVVPDSVTRISVPSLPSTIESVVFGAGITDFESWESPGRTFSYLENLVSVKITAAEGGISGFYDNPALKEFIFNEGVTELELEGCTALEEITLPKTVTYVYFDNMSPKLILQEGNETLALEGNVLYDKNTKKVVMIVEKGSVVLPDGVTWNYTLDVENLTIGNDVFSLTGMYVNGAKVITIGKDVTFVGDSVFYRCKDLTDIYILGDQIEFGDYAFDGLEQEIRIHSNISGEFMANCVGPTFVYVNDNPVDITYEAGKGVIIENYPPQIIPEGGSFSFVVEAEKGYKLTVTVNGGTLTVVESTYTVSGVPATGVKVTMSTEFIGIPTEKIELERSHINVMSGDDIVIGFAVTPFETSDEVVWTSSDDRIVSITKDGIVAVAGGTAILTATCGGQVATCEVVVSAPDVGEDNDENNTPVIITGSVCAGVLVLLGIGAVLLRRRF